MKPFSFKKARRAVFYARSKAKKMGCPNGLTVDEWVNALHASGGICHYCKQDVGEGELTPDHVVPLEKGGSNTIDNIVVACLPCNHSKGFLHELPLYLVLGITKPDPEKKYYHKSIGHTNIVARFALRYLRERCGERNVSRLVNASIIAYARSKMEELDADKLRR